MTATESVTERAEKLIASAERSGGIKLAELSQAELCVLRAETASLVCEQTARWWARLGERRRELVGGLALDFLVWRGALHLPEGANPVQMYEDNQLTNEHLGPELAVILAARRGPRPLAVCQVPGWDELAWCHPRFFSITGPDGRLRVLVCEVLSGQPAALHGEPVFGNTLRYTLLTPEKAAKMITSWAKAIPRRRRRKGSPTATLVSHADGAGLHEEQFAIQPGSDTFLVTRTDSYGQTAPAVTLDEAGTIAELAAALNRMAR
jgi:hypothetical protein